jgi:uncharacterized protein (TIGR00369 family)
MQAKGVDRDKSVSSFTGLKYFKALMEGTAARAPMLELFDINFETAEPGIVVLTATPTAEHYDPLGFVHGGYAAVLLDTCMAAAIVTSLEPSLAAVTLEYKINFIKPMSVDTGVVRGEGKALHIGRQMAIAEGRLLDAAGRLLAHGTTTCHVVRRAAS